MLKDWYPIKGVAQLSKESSMSLSLGASGWRRAAEKEDSQARTYSLKRKIHTG